MQLLFSHCFLNTTKLHKMLCGGGKRNPFASVFVLFLGFMFVILHIVKNRVVLVLYVKWSLSNLSVFIFPPLLY